MKLRQDEMRVLVGMVDPKKKTRKHGKSHNSFHQRTVISDKMSVLLSSSWMMVAIWEYVENRRRKESRTRSATGEVGHFRCLEFREELVIHPILLSHPDTIDEK